MEQEIKPSHQAVLNAMEGQGTMRTLEIAAKTGVGYPSIITRLGIMECLNLVKRIKTSRGRVIWTIVPRTEGKNE